MTQEHPDVEFFFDPVCPFCWVTSRWLRQVARLTDITIGWRLISLRVLNDRPGAYDDKPELYPAVHGVGRDLLRVVAAARREHGPEVVGPLYEAMGNVLWETPAEGIEGFEDVLEVQAAGIDVGEVLATAGLPRGLAAAAGDERWDATLVEETREALDRVGDDVGTPILSFEPPHGPAFFGPVISELPADEDALAYWEALTTLVRMPGFAEIKRSLRSMPVTELMQPLAGSTTRAG